MNLADEFLDLIEPEPALVASEPEPAPLRFAPNEKLLELLLMQFPHGWVDRGLKGDTYIAEGRAMRGQSSASEEAIRQVDKWRVVQAAAAETTAASLRYYETLSASVKAGVMTYDEIRAI